MTLLDDLSGFEFEDVMEDVFRNLGYENVRQAARTADEGRDILMEEHVDGEARAVVVECKHTDTVGRPVVQKLHSAVATYDYDGPKRGIVATTGRFTGPAEEYVAELAASGDPYPIDLLDGTDLRSLADEVGLDLYNGRIEILCEETLRPYDSARGPEAAVEDAFRDIENIEPSAVPDPELWVRFHPVVSVTASVDATFETSVGIVHQIRERDQIVVDASRDGPERVPRPLGRLVGSNLDHRIELDEQRLSPTFDEFDVGRFGRTETEYKEWSLDRLQREHTTTVQYTGDNNVTYTKTCEPNQSDISVESITPVYVPRIRANVDLGAYSYHYGYYAAGPSRFTVDDGIHRCQQCGESDEGPFTYCENCGSIDCPDHIQTERVTGEPVCTGCAVTERFFYSEKYFFDESNLAQFRAEYEAMPPHRKAAENKPLLGAVAVTVLVTILFALVSQGVV
ncbi:restriction endonuclease [Halovenus sp. WSH3]|uniref:Restriction endonuclease n=1 Tax=Halovenus carboxidivorans TaxID=2692199 RepID=A0A6B0T063_9EURY|nr:restriction endonuclease [Halovenus carboxidivorans]MXR51205.1 restriction endonuclease [Halovenus carboxidivorans]